MRSRLLLITFPFLLLLKACTSNETRESSNIQEIKLTSSQTDQTPSDLVVYVAATSIYGEWFNINPNNSIKIVFHRDSTFSYMDGSSSKSSTEGKWTVKGADYVLYKLSESKKSQRQQFKNLATLFTKRFRFKGGFIYEINKDGVLSSDYFVQSKNYR
jgi:hypothetical protein